MNNNNQIKKYEALTHFQNDKQKFGSSLSQKPTVNCKTEPINNDTKNVIVISDDDNSSVSNKPEAAHTKALYKKHYEAYVQQGYSFVKARRFAKMKCILKDTNTDTKNVPYIPHDFDFSNVSLAGIGGHRLSGSGRRRRAVLLRKGYSMTEATVLSFNKMRWCKDQRRKPGVSKEDIQEIRDKLSIKGYRTRWSRRRYYLRKKIRNRNSKRGNSDTGNDDADTDRDSPVTFANTSVNTLNTTSKRIGLLPSEYPSTTWTTIQFEILQQRILNEIRKLPANSEKPNFTGCMFKFGFITLMCGDICTENWIKSVVPTLKPWPNFSLKIVEEEDLPCPQIFTARFPSDNSDNESILKLIENQNKGLGAKKWIVLFRNDDEMYVELTLAIDPMSVNALYQRNNQIKYRSDLVYLENKSKSSYQQTHSNNKWYKRTESALNDNKKMEEYNNMMASFKTNQAEDTSSNSNTQEQQQRSRNKWSMDTNKFTNDNTNSNLNYSMSQQRPHDQEYNRKQNFFENERSINDRRSLNDNENSEFMQYMTRRQHKQISENESFMGGRRNMNDFGNSTFNSSTSHEPQQQRYENICSMDGEGPFNNIRNFFPDYSMSQEQHQQRQFFKNQMGHMCDDERPNSIMRQQDYEDRRCENNSPVDSETYMNNYSNSNSRFSFLQEKQYQEECSENQQQRFENNSFRDVERPMNDDEYSNSSFSQRQQQQPNQQYRQQQYNQQQYNQQQYNQQQYNQQQYNQQQYNQQYNQQQHNQHHYNQQQLNQQQHNQQQHNQQQHNQQQHNQQQHNQQQYNQHQYSENKWSGRERNTNERFNQNNSMTQWNQQPDSENEWPMRFNRTIDDNDSNDNYSNSRSSTIQQDQCNQRQENEWRKDLDRPENENRYSDIFQRRQVSNISNNTSVQENFRNERSSNSERQNNDWRFEHNNNRSDMSRQNYIANSNDMNMPNGPSRWPQWQRNQY